MLTVGLAVLAKTPLAVVAIAGCSAHVDSNRSPSFLAIKIALKISNASSKVSHCHGLCSGRRAEISVYPVKIYLSLLTFLQAVFCHFASRSGAHFNPAATWLHDLASTIHHLCKERSSEVTVAILVSGHVILPCRIGT